MNTLVQLSDVSKRYDGDGPPAVAHVCGGRPRRGRGDHGPSGNGKSTLLNNSGGAALPAILGLVSALTLLIAVVAGLGVLNTVVLPTRERVHDLGVFKAVGMTPRQTITVVLSRRSVKTARLRPGAKCVSGLVRRPSGAGAAGSSPSRRGPRQAGAKKCG